MINKIHISKAIILLLSAALQLACQSEIFLPHSPVEGGLRVTLNNVSQNITSRSTPAELGTPLAADFHLLVTAENGQVWYDDVLKDEVISLPVGSYTVEASYGDNPVVALDAPYYVGYEQVEIAKESVTEAAVACRVGNALVSVSFGQDATEKARFEKFYQDYGLEVVVGDKSVSIPATDAGVSAYLRAGGSAQLYFYGVLRASGQSVHTALDASSTDFPSVFSAADHAIVTLILPDPENVAIVDISKVEMTEATMIETIPLSWLPLPSVVAEHRYDAEGNLLGTDLSFSNSYPGMAWQAEVSDGNGTLYRTISGQGSLTSDYAGNASEWPYLPSGHYVATYYVIFDGEAQKTGSRDFDVAAPDLRLTMDGYTSYTKYLEGDIAAANACDAQTIYAPSASFNVSPSLLSNAHYAHTFTATFDGQDQSTPAAGNTITLTNRTGVAPRSAAYPWRASVTFAGIELSSSTDFYVTGLPYSAEPPTQSDWSGSANSWRSDYVRLHGNTITKTFYVPADVNVNVRQNVYVRRGTVATTYNLQASSQNLCAITPAYNTNETNQDTYPAVLVSSDATVKCVNSYGNPDSIVQGTHAKIYSINVQYR